MSPPEYFIDELNPDYISESFDCGHLYLNSFLKDESIKCHRRKDSFIYMAVDNEKLVGYVALAASKVFAEIDTMQKTYPAVLLGRLAVDNDYKRKGIATNLLLLSIKKALEVSERIGCRLIYAEVEDGSEAIDFYTRNNFVQMKRDRRKSREDPERYLITFYLDFARGMPQPQASG